LKGNKNILMTGVALAALFAVTGCGKKGDAVATVNGESISTEEFYRYMELKPDVRVNTQNGTATLPVDGTIGFQTMQDMIAQRLTLQLAKDKKIYPTDKEIAEEIEFQKKLKPNFLPALTGRGLTMEMIRKSLALDLVQEKLITAGIKKSTADVDRYVKQNPAQFIDPAKVDLSWILVRDPKFQGVVDGELAKGTSFQTAAIQYSDADNIQETKGKLIDTNTGGPPNEANLPPAVRTAIGALREGQMTGWIRFPDGYAKFLVNKKIASRPVVMDDTRKEFLRRLLAKQEGAKARDLDQQILRKLKESNVVINRENYKEPWRAAYERFKLQNKMDTLVGN
jgi:parvulin-like peptidyl-prolyl isomerase